MSKILMTNPAHDDITGYLYVWSQDVLGFASSKGHTVFEIKNLDVRRKKVESFITKQKPELIVFHGHGGKDCICGYGKDEIIIKKDDNDHIFSKNIVYSLTCDSASELGKSIVSKGGSAFIGFKEEIWCPIDTRYMSDPKKDIVAKCNIEPMMQISRSLVKNKTVEHAYKRSQENFKKWLEYAQRSDAPFELEGVAPFIHWNMTNQEIIGDKKARIN